MSKIALSFRILNLLLDENLHKTKEIAEKIQISKSLVRWHINELLKAGIHIDSFTGRYGGYALKKEYCQNNIYKLLIRETNMDKK